MSRSRGSSVQPRNHFGVFGTSIWHHKPDPAVAEPIAIGASTVRPSATRRAYLRTTLSPPPRSRYAPTCRPVTTHTMSFWDPCGYSALKPGEARLKAGVVEVLGAAVDDAGGSVDAASAGAKLLREVPEFKSLASDGKLKTLVNSGELPGFIWVPDPLKAKAGRDTIRRQPLQPLDNRGVDASSAVNSAELRAATAESFIAHLRIRGDPARLCSNKDEFTAQFNEWKDFEKNRLLMRTSGNFVVTLLVVC